MNAKIMIVGLGDLGSVFLDLLLRIPESVEVVVATRNLKRAAPRCNLAQLAALAQGSLSRVGLYGLTWTMLPGRRERFRQSNRRFCCPPPLCRHGGCRTFCRRKMRAPFARGLWGMATGASRSDPAPDARR